MAQKEADKVKDKSKIKMFNNWDLWCQSEYPKGGDKAYQKIKEDNPDEYKDVR